MSSQTPKGQSVQNRVVYANRSTPLEEAMVQPSVLVKELQNGC